MHENLNMTNHDSEAFDLKEVARQAVTGGARDTEMFRHVRERARLAREALVQKLGIQEIGVSIIREMRDSQ